MASQICVAASSTASSQLMTSHLFSPRSPARRSGCSTRRGLYMVCSWLRPLMHRLPRLTGASGSPSSFTTTPSFRYAIAGHIWMQPWQDVFILTRPSSAPPPDGACSCGASCIQPAIEAPNAAVAPTRADALTKLRRVNVVSAMFSNLSPYDGSTRLPSDPVETRPPPPSDTNLLSRPKRPSAPACPRTRWAACAAARRR